MFPQLQILWISWGSFFIVSGKFGIFGNTHAWTSPSFVVQSSLCKSPAKQRSLLSPFMTKQLDPDEILPPFEDATNPNNSIQKSNSEQPQEPPRPLPYTGYDLGLGKNKPLAFNEGESQDSNMPMDDDDDVKPIMDDVTQHWVVPETREKPWPFPSDAAASSEIAVDGSGPINNNNNNNKPTRNTFQKTRKMVARNQKAQLLRAAIDEGHFRANDNQQSYGTGSATTTTAPNGIQKPKLFYPDIDMSIPSSIYNETYDAVWELLQWEAYQEAQREPLLVSFLYSTILNHRSMESSLSFLLANRLSSPMLISTQLQSFILEALEASPEFRRAVRADMLAVRDRDPACTCLPDVFLYFKGKSLYRACYPALDHSSVH